MMFKNENTVHGIRKIMASDESDYSNDSAYINRDQIVNLSKDVLFTRMQINSKWTKKIGIKYGDLRGHDVRMSSVMGVLEE